MIYYEMIKQFLRSFVPYLMEKYRVEKYIDLIEAKLDMKIIKGYYKRFIYRYMLFFFAGLGTFVGIINMIWYFIIH